MLYNINNKCYINVAPSIYVEVVVSEDGVVKATNNKLEVGTNTHVARTTIEDEIKKCIKNEPPQSTFDVDRKYNKRKK